MKTNFGDLYRDAYAQARTNEPAARPHELRVIVAALVAAALAAFREARKENRK